MSGLMRNLSRVGINGFFLSLLLVVFLAWIFPEAGARTSPVPLQHITGYGVAIIFFFYGVRLSPAEFRRGVQHWKLHTVIQLTTFVLFPLFALVLMLGFGDSEQPLWLGLLYLGALPSTVSSSVILVSIAGGNMAGAIFNASLSSVIGIFLTPLWMAPFLSAYGTEQDLSQVFIKLCFQILLPVVIGLLLHSRLGGWAHQYKEPLRYFDQAVILLIVFTAFCDSFLSGMFTGIRLEEILWLGVGMLLFFLVMALLMHTISRWLGFPRADRITILFCGSKKSLVQGAVMGKVLFPQVSSLGIILLPLMIYHALQLLAGSIIAQTLASENEKAEASS